MWRSDIDFDPERKAILLAVGDHSVVNEPRFCRISIARACECFDRRPAARETAT